jgi:hypothetical protein
MRILAIVQCTNGHNLDEALDAAREAFTKNQILNASDPIERREAIDELIHDMKEADRYRFQKTVRYVARHLTEGTVASIGVEDDGYVVVRLRNHHLQVLVRTGHAILTDLLQGATSPSSPLDSSRLALRCCEIRENGHDVGFIFGQWAVGELSALRFLFSQRTTFFKAIAVLFVVGLTLEVALSLGPWKGQLVDLGLRLGAPMLVSSTVLILERWAQWSSEKHASLRWMSTPPHDGFDPFKGSKP